MMWYVAIVVRDPEGNEVHRERSEWDTEPLRNREAQRWLDMIGTAGLMRVLTLEVGP